MATIEERAKEFACEKSNGWEFHSIKMGYIKGAKDQQAIDIDKACYVFAKAVEKLSPLFPTEEARTTVVEQFRKAIEQ